MASIPHLPMAEEISAYFADVARRVVAGEQITWDQMCRHVQELAREKYGCEYGVPLPSIESIENPLVLARGTPLREILALSQSRTSLEIELQQKRIPIRNSWTQLGDQEIVVVDTEMGPIAWYKPKAGIRLRIFMRTWLLRTGTQQTAEAELRAIDALRTKIGALQFSSYVLNGTFPEKSPRSGVHYIFRKGFPTLALRFDRPDDGERLLAALCCHPMGYYVNTFCGIMCPTDEVIANLLLMRADERKFWAKSGQWHGWDIRSGL